MFAQYLLMFYRFILSFLLVTTFFLSAQAQEETKVYPHPSLPNVYVEAVVDPKLNPRMNVVKENLFLEIRDENGERKRIPLEMASAEQMLTTLKQDTNLNRAVKGTVTAFPKEYGKFNGAMVALELVACFGGSVVSLTPWQSSSSTPLCMDHLIHSLTTLEGNIGFFNFILVNRIASAHLTNLATITSLAINKPKTPQLIASMRPYIGYVGMSFGMAAQQMTSHILTIPTFKECAKDISRGVFNSSFCVEAANHFLSAEKFWLDYSAGLPSLIGGAAMSSGSHWLIKNAKFLKAPEALHGLTTEGVAGYMKNIKRLKMASNLVMVGGAPGILVRAGIGVGEVVIFLAWTKFLEMPTMKMMWTWFDRPDIKSNTQLLIKTAKEIEKAGGFAESTVDISCRTQRSRGGTQQKCNSIDYLAQSLRDLRFHTRRYRERVTLAELQRSFPDWMTKWEKYVTSYFTAKIVVQEIYAQKPVEPNVLLSLYDTGFVVQSVWGQFFTRTTQDTTYKTYLRTPFEKVKNSFENLQKAYEQNSTSIPNLEKTLAEDLVSFKKIVEKENKYDPSTMCGGVHRDPYFCKATQVVRLIPQRTSVFFNQTQPANLYTNVVILKQLSQTLPIAETLRELMCSRSTQLKSNSGFRTGLPATLQLPRIVLGLESDPFYEESCRMANLAKNILPEPVNISEDGSLFDVQPTLFWFTETANFVDPISFLTSPTVKLSPGKTELQAQTWWNKNMLPEVLSFYVNYISQLKEMLDKHFLSRFAGEENVSTLLSAGLSDNEAENLKLLTRKIANKYRLDLSLIGQMQILVQALNKVASPGLSSIEKRELEQQTQFLLGLFAEHVRHFTYQNEPISLRSLLSTELEKLISKPLDADPRAFSKAVTEQLFSYSYKQKNTRQRALQVELGKLSELLVGENLDRIENIEKRLDFTAQQVAAMPPEEYRKYTVLQIIQHMSLVVDETTTYYDNFLFLAGLFNFFEK
jgi:hypothetical protein